MADQREHVGIYPPWPPTITSSQLSHLKSYTQDWCLSHGLVVRPKPDSGLNEATASAAAIAAPVTLFPSLFAKKEYEKARRLQKAYNELYARIAGDQKWLGSVVGE